MKIFTNDQLQQITRYTVEEEGVYPTEMIQRMAEGVTAEVVRLMGGTTRPITVFAGPGNNGAEALSVARMLTDQGFAPIVYLFNIRGNSINRECRECKEALLATGRARLVEIIDSMEPPELKENYIVVDGLFGAGLREPLSGGFMTLVRDINESGAKVVSIDIPSGLMADWNPSTIARNVVHATVTCTAQYPHLSFFIADNAELVGRVKIIDVGISSVAARNTTTKYHLVEEGDISHVLKPRKTFANKSDFGSPLLIAGSYGMMGAAVMAATGALRSGAGKVTVYSPRCGFNILQTAVPEAMFRPDKNDIVVSDMLVARDYDAVGIGPGLGTAEMTSQALETLFKQYRRPLVVDADALNIIARRPLLLTLLPQGSIITPHTGEFDRIAGESQTSEGRLLKAVDLARKYNIIIVLKGHYTATIRPDGKVFFNSTGGPGMATGGSGDVLTGVITSLLGQGYPPELSAVIGVYIHGLAGDIAARDFGDYGTTAGDIAKAIAPAIKSLLKS